MTSSHRVFTGPAREMGQLEENSADLVVTSPPYPLIEMWDDSFGRQDPAVGQALDDCDGPAAFEAMHRILDTVWSGCFRVLKPGSFACINTGDAVRTLGPDFRLYTNHARIISGCTAAGFQTLPFILWRKPTNAPNKFMGSGMLPAGAYVTLEHEYILVFRKGGKRVFAGDDLKRRRRSAYFREERNSWFSDVWDFRGSRQRMTGASVRERSAAFPFELAFRLINMYSLQEDTVLDPFMGTGTTAAAALAAGRNSTGFELEPELLPVIAGRLLECAATSGRVQEERIKAHLASIGEYRAAKGKEPGHMNGFYGFPVMTSQETDLRLPVISKVETVSDVPLHIRAEHLFGRFDGALHGASQGALSFD